MNDAAAGMVLATLDATLKPQLFTGTPDANDGLAIPFGVGRQKRKVVGPGCFATGGYDSSLDCQVASCATWDFAMPASEITSVDSFCNWYHTTTGVNQEILGELALNPDPVTANQTFDSAEFFPSDGVGFGNTAGQTHNYHSHYRSHVEFVYELGQAFTFRGDDDL
ncbi:MAG: hypothetical protein U5M51_11635 [Emticicia sp.]|nr:hypothetical protein [Emticicia sp.]